MNNEQIAREARETLQHLGGGDDYWQRVESIILAAIEKATEFYSLRFNALQKQQHDMREPERTMVCDILANASTHAQPPATDATAEQTEIAKALRVHAREVISPEGTNASTLRHNLNRAADILDAKPDATAEDRKCQHCGQLLAKWDDPQICGKCIQKGCDEQ